MQAHVFRTKTGACAAFLANYNSKSFAKVSFGSMHYNLPPWSISILPDCRNTVYNTARVREKRILDHLISTMFHFYGLHVFYFLTESTFYL